MDFPPLSPKPHVPTATPSRAVVGLALAALLIALGLFVTELVLGRQRVLDRAQDDVRTSAHQLAEQAARLLGAHALILRNAEWLVQTQGWDDMAATPRVHEWLRQLAQEAPEVQSYWLVDAGGQVRVNTFRWPTQVLNVADRDYFVPHEAGIAGPFVSARLSGRINPEIFFALSRRVEDANGGFQGVVQVSLRPAYFESFYASIAIRPDTEVLLVRNDGEALVRHPAMTQAGTALGNAQALLERRRQSGDRFTALSPFDGVERYYAVRDVDGMPVRILFGVGTSGVAAEWRQLLLGHVSFAIVAVALLVPLAFIALRQTRQVERAQAELRGSNARLEARVRDRTAHLDSALDDLRNSEERLSRLVKTTPVAIFEVDETGRFTDANAAAERMLGIPRAGLVGTRFDAPTWQATLVDGRPLASVDYPAARALRGDTVREMEIAIRDPQTGARQVLSVNAAPIRDEVGHIIGCTTTAMDVTGRYEAEDRQRLLMREVDHRAKNALAVAQAVVRLSRADTIKGFMEAVEGRISSLARSHSLLAQAAWSGADLEKMLEEELLVFAGDAARLVLHGPRVHLNADMVQSLGLVFHELATNAAKHGALSVPDGMVSIEWTVKRNVLNLEWTEEGGPPVTQPPGHEGFGSTLLGQVLRHQLGGRIDMEWRLTGLRCCLTLPLAVG